MTSPDPEPRWDFSTMLLILFVVALLLFLTFDLWGPHAWSHR